MNTEQWIEENEFDVNDSSNGDECFVVEADKLRALFKGKVPVELLEKKVINKYSDEYSMAFHDGWNELIDDITASQEPKQ